MTRLLVGIATGIAAGIIACAESLRCSTSTSDPAGMTRTSRRWWPERASGCSGERRPPRSRRSCWTSTRPRSPTGPAYRINGWGRVINGGCDLQHGPCGPRAWQALGQSKALAPTLALAPRTHELGMAVFFVADFKAPERRRMSEQGYTIVLALGDQESDLELLPALIPRLVHGVETSHTTP